MSKNENLGIPNFNPVYIQVLPEQNFVDEIIDIHRFIKDEIEAGIKLGRNLRKEKILIRSSRKSSKRWYKRIFKEK